MKLFEYQSKALFAEEGVSVPRGVVVESSEELDQAIDTIGTPCAVKAQVLTGGRGKAGLIRFAATGEEAAKTARELFASNHGIRKLLLEEAVEIDRELYIAVTVDPVEAGAVLMACAEGGVEIETLAAEAPEKIRKEHIDLSRGLMDFQARSAAYDLGLTPSEVKAVSRVMLALYRVFARRDAELVEVNPLFITKDGAAVAGDGKIVLDDNALFRQPGYELTREHFTTDTEFEAAQEGIPFLQFDGEIGLMCAGAGLTTTVFDLIHYAGGTVANYLEFGGPNYRKAVRAMELCLSADSNVILVVTFGTIARADVMAEGLVEAIRRLKPDRPVVVCIRGTNEEAAVRILREAGLDPLLDTEEAVDRAVAIAKGGSL